MKTQTSVPTTKVARATQFVKAGVKVGGNYIKHYSKKLIDPSLSREELHKDNATDIYDALSELKGSALKMAQTPQEGEEGAPDMEVVQLDVDEEERKEREIEEACLTNRALCNLEMSIYTPIPVRTGLLHFHV